MMFVIEDKGNGSFKLTITQDNVVRIKLQTNLNKKIKDDMIEKIKNIAIALIDDGVNTQTIRGQFKYGAIFLNLYTDSKKFVTKITL
jgi:hypothetical protein